MFEPCYGSSECPTDSSFESEGSSSESDNDEMPSNRLVDNTDWCSCGCCVPVQTAVDAVCCQELPEAVAEIQRGECNTIQYKASLLLFFFLYFSILINAEVSLTNFTESFLYGIYILMPVKGELNEYCMVNIYG